MSNIHDTFKDECVSGQIVGAVMLSGALYYDGRKQGGTFYTDSLEELQSLCKAKYQEIKNESGEVFNFIYPADVWEIREYS